MSASEEAIHMKLSHQEQVAKLPGYSGLWTLVVFDLIQFSCFFLSYMYWRGAYPELFRAGQAKLSLSLGMLNTIVLLSSSFFVVSAVRDLRASAAKKARRWLLAGVFCGIGFIGLKAIEYSAHADAGIGLRHDLFFIYYYSMTGLHALHVTAGLIWFSILLKRIGRIGSKVQTADVIALESGATFWHLVDILWIFIFPLLYLLK